MTRSQRRGDPDNIVGNVYDKYRTRNPIARLLMRGFLNAISELYDTCKLTSILEVGCGEGNLAQFLHSRAPPSYGFTITDLDVSRVRPDLPASIEVVPASIYALPYPARTFDLVVCCEVLEHLEQPQRGLDELARVASHRILISTPWEPAWRALNMLRGRYVRDLGNTPGHVQHFSRRGLHNLVRPRIRVVAERTPLPWTILLGEPRA